MNGAQDLGGQMGFGPIAPEANEPVFHAEWEKRALGVTLCAGAMSPWTLDEGRHARESLHPADYYSSSYYEIWIKGLEKLLKRHGFVSERDLAEGRAIDGAPTPDFVLKAADVPRVLAGGGPCSRPIDAPPRFKAGDRVRTKTFNPTGHTRLPRYARGRVGIVDAVRGGYVFPDTSAHDRGENPQHLYTVVFTSAEIWGDGADPTLSVSIDAWESYLEPA